MIRKSRKLHKWHHDSHVLPCIMSSCIKQPEPVSYFIYLYRSSCQSNMVNHFAQSDKLSKSNTGTGCKNTMLIYSIIHWWRPNAYAQMEANYKSQISGHKNKTLSWMRLQYTQLKTTVPFYSAGAVDVWRLSWAKIRAVNLTQQWQVRRREMTQWLFEEPPFCLLMQ